MKRMAIAAALLATSCSESGDVDDYETRASEAESYLADLEARIGEVDARWVYDTSRDEARSADIHYASLKSRNAIMLAPPYDGGTRAELTIRQHPEYGLDIYVTARPSQILCRSYEPCQGLINIDGNPEPLTMVGPESLDTETVFFRYDEAMLPKLIGSKRVIIELPFYANGRHQFTFDTSGLEWPRP